MKNTGKRYRKTDTGEQKSAQDNYNATLSIQRN